MGKFFQLDCELQVESALIDELDMRVSQNKGDEEYRQLFNSM